MTASEFARLLKARRIGKGKWTARCPSHPDRKPSLAIAEGRKGVVIKCMSHGCETKDILAAMGLSFADLYEGKPPDRKMMQQIRDADYKWERQEKHRRGIKNLALERAGLWEKVSSRLSLLLWSFPESEKVNSLFERSLSNVRFYERMADAVDFPCPIGMGFPKTRKSLTVNFVGLEIAARIGLEAKEGELYT